MVQSCANGNLQPERVVGVIQEAESLRGKLGDGTGVGAAISPKEEPHGRLASSEPRGAISGC